MGVYIKGMEMPKAPLAIKGCRAYMDFRIWDDGTVEARIGPKETEYKAIPVPPHGNLIDRAELWVEINKICDRRDAGIITDLVCLQQILSAVRHAPTIIPAEEVKEP